MIWAIGLDDTDYPTGGCTTWQANELENVLIQCGAKPIERRLVRLWPFAFRRTRGNAALAIIVEITSNIQQRCIDAINIWFDKLILEIKNNDTESHARPGLIICKDGEFSESIYWECVRSEFSDVSKIIGDSSLIHYLISDLGNDGLIGAAAAVSWRPIETSTYEAIAWRELSNFGTDRKIPKNAIQMLENNHPNTFMNRDPTYDRGLISPRSPCPILFGIRGWSYRSTSDALEEIIRLDWNEQVAASSIHITNQCSDDHLDDIIEGTVLVKPIKKQGGHVAVDIVTKSGFLKLISFKEGGILNTKVSELLPGDQIHVLGLISPEGYLHIERLKSVYTSPGNLVRPKCSCGGSLKSTGKLGKLRCKLCKYTETSHWISSRRLTFDWVEPSPSSRRHLSKPVSRMN